MAGFEHYSQEKRVVRRFMTLPKVVILKTFNRANLLENCLSSLFNNRKIEEFLVIVVQQEGNNQVRKVLENNLDRFDTYVKTNPIGVDIDSYITSNMMLGYSIAFDFWNAKYAISIEDDVVLAQDALSFVDYAYELYKGNSRFRGVNLGSILPHSKELEHTFSRTRFGVHGPAGMITNRTWGRLNQKKILRNRSVIFDAQLEFSLKSGFMIAPNNSRYMDLGFGGSHSLVTDSANSYFKGLENSFTANYSGENSYKRVDVDPMWRRDCLIYDSKENWKFDLREKVYPYLSTTIGKKYISRRMK